MLFRFTNFPKSNLIGPSSNFFDIVVYDAVCFLLKFVTTLEEKCVVLNKLRKQYIPCVP